MRISDGGETCQGCGEAPSVIYCDNSFLKLCTTTHRYQTVSYTHLTLPTKRIV